MFPLNTQLIIIKFGVHLQEDTIAQIFAEPIPLSWGDVSTDWEHTLYVSLWGRRRHNVKRSWGQSGKCSSVAYPELKSITAVALCSCSIVYQHFIIIIIIIIFLAHQHKACRQLKIKQEMTAVGD